jgi:hypothetical protein
MSCSALPLFPPPSLSRSDEYTALPNLQTDSREIAAPLCRVIDWGQFQALFPDFAQPIHQALPEYFDDYKEGKSSDMDGSGSRHGNRKEKRQGSRREESGRGSRVSEPGHVPRLWLACLGPHLYVRHLDDDDDDDDDEDEETPEGKHDEREQRKRLKVVVLDKTTLAFVGQHDLQLGIQAEPLGVVHMTADDGHLVFLYVDAEGG